MFCNKCGAPLNEDGSCPSCDAQRTVSENENVPVEPATETQPEQTQAPTPEQPVQPEQTQAPTPEQPVQPEQTQAPTPEQPAQTVYQAPAPEKAPKKKMSKGLKAVIIIVAILCVLGGIVCLFRAPLLRLFMGEARYYAVAESKNATETAQELQSLIKENAEMCYGTNTTLSISGDSTLSMFEDLKIEVSAQQDGEAGKSLTELKLTDGDHEIGSIGIMTDNGKTALTLMGDDTLYGSDSPFASDIAQGSFCESCTGKTEVELATFGASYLETVLSAIPKDKIETKRSLSGDTVTFTIDDETICAIAGALSERIRDDDELRDIVHTFYGFLKENESLFEDADMDLDDSLTDKELDEAIDDLADELKDASEDYESDTVIQYAVTYSFFGDITKREISVENGSDSGVITLECIEDGYRFKADFDMGDDGSMSFDFQDTETALTGNVSVNAEGDEMKADFDFDKKEVEDITVYVGETSIDVAGTTITVKSALDDDTLNLDISTEIEGISVTLNAETVFSDEPDCDSVDLEGEKTEKLTDDVLNDMLEELQENLMSSPSLALFFMFNGSSNEASYDDYYGMDDYDYGDYDYDDYDYGDYDDYGYGDTDEV